MTEQVSDVEGRVADLRDAEQGRAAFEKQAKRIGELEERLVNARNQLRHLWRGDAATAIETLSHKQAEDAKRIGEMKCALEYYANSIGDHGVRARAALNRANGNG